ncbi:MAG TPA: enolase C-terminal domain-like protein, partial [bacterium]
MALGGLIATLRVARAAFTQGVPVVVTTMLEGVYGRTAALHVAAALQAAALSALAQGRVTIPACGLATGHLLGTDLVPAPPVPASGMLRVPIGVGLGIVAR